MTKNEFKQGDKVRNKRSCNKGIVLGAFTDKLVEVRVLRGNANPYTSYWKTENIELIPPKRN